MWAWHSVVSNSKIIPTNILAAILWTKLLDIHFRENNMIYKPVFDWFHLQILVGNDVSEFTSSPHRLREFSTHFLDAESTHFSSPVERKRKLPFLDFVSQNVIYIRDFTYRWATEEIWITKHKSVLSAQSVLTAHDHFRILDELILGLGCCERLAITMNNLACEQVRSIRGKACST